MAIWLVLIILGYVGTIIINWQSIKERDCWTHTALICVFLGAAGAIKITYDTNDSSEKLMAKTNENATLSRELAASQKKSYEDLQKSNAQLLVTTAENAGLSKELASSQVEMKFQAQQNSDKLMKSSEQLTAETRINADLSRKVIELQNQLQASMHEEIELVKGDREKLTRIDGNVDYLKGKGIITGKAAENLKEEIKNVIVALPSTGVRMGTGELKVTTTPPPK